MQFRTQLMAMVAIGLGVGLGYLAASGQLLTLADAWAEEPAKKQAEQAQLGKQIEALQTAAEQLRGVAHLLDDEAEERAVAAGRG